MEKFRVYGASTKEESQRERDHRAIARKAAADGFVLLKNDNVLPIEPQPIALLGAGSRMTVKGGAGSGDAQERSSVSIEQGLLNAGFTLPNTLWNDRFEQKFNENMAKWKADIEEKCKKYSPIRTMEMFIMIGEHPKPQPGDAPIKADEMPDNVDTAVYVLARQAGEGGDRKYEKADYLMSDVEIESIKLLSKKYKKLILVINSGGIVDLSVLDEVRVDAVIYFAQGGMEGGNALADIITGKVTPSGKLTDTWGYSYEDYPSATEFSHINGNLDNENYKEGIYVGYRYFNSFGIKPRYSFGYGLSYTEFSHKVSDIAVDKLKISIKVDVKNIGSKYNGREVIQVYLKKPGNKYDTESISLAAFAKTGVLNINEKETMSLSFDMAEQGVFDENKNAFVLEKGEYGVFIGASADGIEPICVLNLDKDVTLEIVSKTDFAKPDFEDIKCSCNIASYDDSLPYFDIKSENFITVTHKKYAPDFSEKVKSVLSELNYKDKISLVVGGGYSIKCFNNVLGAAGRTATNLLKKGIPNIVLSDGPAGLNVNQAYVVTKTGTPRYQEGLPESWQWGWLNKFGFLVKAKEGSGRPVYHYMTAFPCATLQAQSWDVDLIEQVGRAIGVEMLEIGVSVWLAPGMNIHRNPLCGRNFEYYSEDPLVAGKMAAAVTRGVQGCGGVGVSVKHYCCNNQEDNRTGVSENVSNRALREIYLRAFRIAVNEGKPSTVMSSYNKVNGKYVVNSYDLCTRVLRDEWNYNGLVMSDWNSTEQCSYANAINAGNDLIMPGTAGVRKSLINSFNNGELDKNALDISAMRVLKLVYDSATTEGF